MPEHAIWYRMELDGQIDNRNSDIRHLCHDYGVGTPQIQVEGNWITVVFERKTAPSEDILRS